MKAILSRGGLAACTRSSIKPLALAAQRKARGGLEKAASERRLRHRAKRPCFMLEKKRHEFHDVRTAGLLARTRGRLHGQVRVPRRPHVLRANERLRQQ